MPEQHPFSETKCGIEDSVKHFPPSHCGRGYCFFFPSPPPICLMIPTDTQGSKLKKYKKMLLKMLATNNQFFQI